MRGCRESGGVVAKRAGQRREWGDRENLFEMSKRMGEPLKEEMEMEMKNLNE